MPWQPSPKMQVQDEVSQVRSQRNRCGLLGVLVLGLRRSTRRRSRARAEPGRANSIQVRGMSSETSGTAPAYGPLSLAFATMRLGVLDIGSNTVHLLVVDAHPGAHPLPAYSHKVALRLAEYLEDGRIGAAGATALAEIIQDAPARSPRTRACRTSSPLPPARSARRPTARQVLDDIRTQTGVAAAGAVRPGRGPADLPRRTPLVRLVQRAPARARHRRRLAGDRRRPGRGAGRRAEPAAGRRPADPRAPARRPADPEEVRALRRQVRIESAPSCATSSRPARPTGSSARPRRCARWPGSPGRRPSSEGQYAARELARRRCRRPGGPAGRR